MRKFTPSRRDVLKGIAAGGLSLSFAGYATAANGEAQYIVTTRGRGGVRRLEREGFEIQRKLANDEVLLATGPENASSNLLDINGVEAAARNVRLVLKSPVKDELPAPNELDVPDFYETYLWDKQNIESVEANEIATGDGASVGIIDTGIDYEHPELLPNLDKEAGRLFRDGDIRSGIGEIIVPDNYPDPTALKTEEFHVADEQQGHGTHVAGIAAAADSYGVIGTAPDADVISLRVFWWTMVEDPETGEEEPGIATTTGDVLNAINHGAEKGYDAVNLSLGTLPLHPSEIRPHGIRQLKVAYHKVVQWAVQEGTVVVASAGNSETNLSRQGLFSLPNSVEGAMSISATGPNDKLAFYSDYGTSEVDVGAPGGGYETLEKTIIDDPAKVGWPFPTNLVFSAISPRVEGASYGWKAGTSMAAPQVAGLVALVRELEGDARPHHIESAIKHGAEGGTGRSDPELGAGRINAKNTVELLVDNDDGNITGIGNGNGSRP